MDPVAPFEFERDPSPFAALWALDPQVAYLNHGSFGACPCAVLAVQTELRTRLEREPVDFLVRELPARLGVARVALGAFVHAQPEGLAFVANATAGVNTVLRSLDLAPGDEVVTTDHTYAACRKALDHVAAQRGARVVTARVPFPLAGADDVIEPVLSAVTPRTRLALLDHVTSPTGLVFPLERLVPALRERGVETLVDGAHALGMIALDLDALGAAYYTANAHKWLCAPKGSAFLHVRRDRRRGLHPLVISHGYDAAGDAFRAEFDWTGTADPTPWLVIPDCLAHLGAQLEGGWRALMARNRALALQARAFVAAALGVAPPCPDDLIGALGSLPLAAPRPGSPAAHLDHEGLMNWCRERGVETWSYPWPCAGGRLVRVSAQLYNSAPQFRALAALLREAHGLDGE